MFHFKKRASLPLNYEHFLENAFISWFLVWVSYRLTSMDLRFKKKLKEKIKAIVKEIIHLPIKISFFPCMSVKKKEFESLIYPLKQ